MEYLPSNLPYKSAKCRYSKYTCTFQFGCQMVPLQGVNSTCSLGFYWHPLEGAGTIHGSNGQGSWRVIFHPFNQGLTIFLEGCGGVAL